MSDVLKMVNKLFLVSVIALISISCEVGFNPNTDADSIPVVYGIIDPDDSLYSIRLTKTFQCTGSTKSCVKQPTVQYFTNPTVELELLTLDGKLLNRGELVSMIAAPKESGFFSQDPNIIYGIDRSDFEFENDVGPVITPHHLILKINTSETSLLTYSDVEVRVRPTIIYPRNHNETNFALFDQNMERVTWIGFPDLFNNVVFRVGYFEQLEDSSRMDFFDVNFPVDPFDLADANWTLLEYQIDGMKFLKTMKRWFSDKEIPNGLQYRKITSLDVLVVSITDNYRLYVNALSRDANVDIREPSNITNGIGLFALKRTTTSFGHSFNFETMDSIANSQITKNLKFVKW